MLVVTSNYFRRFCDKLQHLLDIPTPSLDAGSAACVDDYQRQVYLNFLQVKGRTAILPPCLYFWRRQRACLFYGFSSCEPPREGSRERNTLQLSRKNVVLNLGVRKGCAGFVQVVCAKLRVQRVAIQMQRKQPAPKSHCLQESTFVPSSRNTGELLCWDPLCQEPGFKEVRRRTPEANIDL